MNLVEFSLKRRVTVSMAAVASLIFGVVSFTRLRQKLDLITLPREISKPVILRFDPANDPVLRLTSPAARVSINFATWRRRC